MLGVDRFDDAAGEIEVAADQLLDISRLDTVLPVLGEVPHIPLELIVRTRQTDQPAFGRGIGDELHVPHIYMTYHRLQWQDFDTRDLKGAQGLLEELGT